MKHATFAGAGSEPWQAGSHPLLLRNPVALCLQPLLRGCMLSSQRIFMLLPLLLLLLLFSQEGRLCRPPLYHTSASLSVSYTAGHRAPGRSA